MRFFRKRVEVVVPPVRAEEAAPLPSPPRVVALGKAERKLLTQPVDPRVERLLSQLAAERVTAESEGAPRRIINFPASSGLNWSEAIV
jgi:hypothetical protein